MQSARLTACALLLAATCAAADELPRTRAGGALLSVGDSRLELLGEIWASLPVARRQHPYTVYLELDTTTSVVGSDGLTFTLRELILDSAWAVDLDRRRRWRARLGGRARVLIDADGDTLVDYLAVERRSAASDGRSWHVALGPALGDRGLGGDEARAVLDAALRLPFARLAGGTLVGEAELGGTWLDDAGGRFDTSVGLAWTRPFDAEHVLELVAAWQRGRSPLGLGQRIWTAGFRYRTGEAADAPWRERRAPDVNGAIGAVSGPRAGGRFRLEVVSPEFGPGLRLLSELDVSTLSGDTAHDLFYRYHVGFERDLRRGRAGVFYHHRSNHVLDGTIPGITSLDVIELGWSGGPRQRAGRPQAGETERHQLSGELRAGVLLDSDFGEERRWHLRGRGRWSPPWRLGGVRPYVEAEGATGDVTRYGAGVGLALGERFDLGLARLADEQWFDEQRRVWAVTARYAF